MPYSLFRRCSGLTSVNIADSRCKKIGALAFEYISSLTSATLSSSIDTIGSDAFSYCSSLKVDLTHVRYIDGQAFQLCSSLSGIPSTLLEIGEEAFYGCQFTSATIGSSTDIVGGWPFTYMPNLTLSLNSSNPYYKLENNTLYTKDGKTLVGATRFLSSIPSGTESINNYAFKYFDTLQGFSSSITFPSSLVDIGREAFQCNYQQNMSLTFNNGIRYIGEWAFNQIYFESLTLPSSISSIGDRNFSVNGNPSPDSSVLTVLATTPPSLGSNCFLKSNSTTYLTQIRVPSASLSRYQSATNWSSFASIMVGI